MSLGSDTMSASIVQLAVMQTMDSIKAVRDGRVLQQKLETEKVL